MPCSGISCFVHEPFPDPCSARSSHPWGAKEIEGSRWRDRNPCSIDLAVSFPLPSFCGILLPCLLALPRRHGAGIAPQAGFVFPGPALRLVKAAFLEISLVMRGEACLQALLTGSFRAASGSGNGPSVLIDAGRYVLTICCNDEKIDAGSRS